MFTNLIFKISHQLLVITLIGTISFACGGLAQSKIIEGHQYPLTISLTMTEEGEPIEKTRESGSSTVITSSHKFVTKKFSNKEIVNLAKELGYIDSIAGWSVSQIIRTRYDSDNELFRGDGCFLTKKQGGIIVTKSLDGLFQPEFEDVIESESSTESQYPDGSYTEKQTEGKYGFLDLRILPPSSNADGDQLVLCKGVARWTVTDTSQEDGDGNWFETEIPSNFKISNISGSYYNEIIVEYSPLSEPAEDLYYFGEDSYTSYYYSEYDETNYYSTDGGETFYTVEDRDVMIEGSFSVSKGVAMNKLPEELYINQYDQYDP
jgi:hypothetical protein